MEIIQNNRKRMKEMIIRINLTQKAHLLNNQVPLKAHQTPHRTAKKHKKSSSKNDSP
jgi:hypothetical protein